MNLHHLVMNHVEQRDPFHDPRPGDTFRAVDRVRTVKKIEKGWVFYECTGVEHVLQTRLVDWRGWNRRESVKLVKRGDE